MRLLNYTVRALREIRHYQKTSGTIIPRTVMRELVTSVLLEHTEGRKLRITAEAHAIIQLVAEPYLIKWFKMLNLSAIYARRQTIMPRDAEFVRWLIKVRNSNDVMAQPVELYPDRR